MRKQKVADHVFARYPKADTVYITGDNQAFFTIEEAEAHAPRLSDRKIKTIERNVKEEDEDSDTENLGDGTNQHPFKKISGEGLVERKPSDYDAPGATVGADKETSDAANYGKQADLAKAKAEKEAVDKVAADKKAAEDNADADAAAKKAKDEAAKTAASDEGDAPDSPEYSMRNTKPELLAAAKGLEITDEMTKQEILDVLYPSETKAE